MVTLDMIRKPVEGDLEAFDELRVVVVARLRLPDEVRIADGHRAVMRFRMAHGREAAILRDVEPLVGVGRPGVG